MLMTTHQGTRVTKVRTNSQYIQYVLHVIVGSDINTDLAHKKTERDSIMVKSLEFILPTSFSYKR